MASVRLPKSAKIPNSIGFVITHGLVTSKLGERDLKNAGAEQVIIIEVKNKHGSIIELKRIRDAMKEKIKDNVSRGFLYAEFNAAMSGKNKLTAAYLLNVFIEMEIPCSLHGLPGSGGIMPETISEEEKSLGIVSLTADEARIRLENPDFFQELATRASQRSDQEPVQGEPGTEKKEEKITDHSFASSTTPDPHSTPIMTGAGSSTLFANNSLPKEQSTQQEQKNQAPKESENSNSNTKIGSDQSPRNN
jgi:hypothetical protein